MASARESSQPGPGGRMPPSTAAGTPAATIPAGRPYFVMELVRGIKITDYCDQNQLSTKERLGLFIKVCQAIQPRNKLPNVLIVALDLSNVRSVVVRAWK